MRNLKKKIVFAFLVLNSRRFRGSSQASALVAFRPEAPKRLNIKTLASKRQKHLNWLIIEIIKSRLQS